MKTATVRAIHLPHQHISGGLPLPIHLLLLVLLLGAAFVALWIATVAEALHPYGKPEARPEHIRAP